MSAAVYTCHHGISERKETPCPRSVGTAAGWIYTTVNGQFYLNTVTFFTR